MTFINSIPKFTGQNYGIWREELEVNLALAEIDLALTEKAPTEPTAPVRGESETDAAWTARVRDHAPVQAKYNLDKAKWNNSNRKCLMVIKKSISEGIRGAIPDCATATEYLEKVKNHFIGSTKVYASTLIERLSTMKYNGGGVRDHILSMSTMAAKLKTMNMGLPDPYIVHLALNSLPGEFSTFIVNYNSQPDEWDIEKAIAMCTQEEERLKKAHGGSLNFVQHNKRKKFHDKNARPQGKPHWERGSSSNPSDKFQKKDPQQAESDECLWCHSKTHRKKDCPDFLKHLLKKGEDTITFIDEILYLSYDKSTWWIDSGATVHVANSLQGISMRRTLQRGERWLKVANGVTADVEETG